MTNKEGLLSVETPFKVEFYDVDTMQVVWHGNYLKYMEMGRCALLEKIGYGYLVMEREGFAFPVTNVDVKYIKSLRFNETAVIKSILLEYENYVKIKYEIYNSKGEITTKAETTQMALKISTWESQFVCPQSFIEKVEKVIEKK